LAGAVPFLEADKTRRGADKSNVDDVEVTGKQIGYDHMPKATSAPETEKKEQMACQPKTTNHAS